jgi:hypothetical protein
MTPELGPRFQSAIESRRHRLTTGPPFLAPLLPTPLIGLARVSTDGQDAQLQRDALRGPGRTGKGAGMPHRRRPRWELERVIRLTVTVLNTAASMIDAPRRFR